MTKSSDLEQIGAEAVPSEKGDTTRGADDTGRQGFPSPMVLSWILAILMAYFGARLVYFAVNISGFVPPDEVSHFGLAKVFSQAFLLPANSPQSYEYGLVTNIPYLYYWCCGKLLHLNFLGLPDLVFLRLLNIPLAFGTVWFALRTLRLFSRDGVSQLLLAVAMTNTLMFSFLSASVSYDNLNNLLAAMSVYYLLAFFRERSARPLVASVVCQLAGCLTKTAFLPLALVLTLLLFAHEFRNLGRLPAAVRAYFAQGAKRTALPVLALVLGLALNVQLYGGNYLHYGKLAPEMQDVLSSESAMQNRLAARDMIFTMFKEGKVAKDEALAMTSRITHPVDREGTVTLIETYDQLKANGTELIGPLSYLPEWGFTMLPGIFGIYGHLSMPNDGENLTPLVFLWFVAGIAFLMRWRPRDAEGLPAFLAVISGCYAAFLIYAVNYKIYRYYGSPWVGLQGRYIFPVLAPIYVLCSCYLPRLFANPKARWAIAVLAALVFLSSDFPFFLSHVTPEWFTAPVK